MGTYEELKAAIQQVIRTNGNNEITGALLQNAFLSIVNVVGANATFAGIATPNTNPGTADQNVFYLATESGMYVNFGGIVINKGEAVILSNKTGNWVKTISGLATSAEIFVDSEEYMDTIAELYIVVPLPTEGYLSVKQYYGSIYVRNAIDISTIAASSWQVNNTITDVRNNEIISLTCTTASNTLGVNVGDVVGYIIFKDIDKFKSANVAIIGRKVYEEKCIDISHNPIIMSWLISEQSFEKKLGEFNDVVETHIANVSNEVFIADKMKGTLAELYIIAPKNEGTLLAVKHYNNEIIVRYGTNLINNETFDNDANGWQCRMSLSTMKENEVIPLLCTTASTSLGVAKGDVIGYIIFKDLEKFKSVSVQSVGFLADDNKCRDIRYSPVIHTSLLPKQGESTLVSGVNIYIPSTITAVVGDTMQIYWRSIISAFNPYMYDIYAVSSVGKSYPRYYEFTPTNDMIGKIYQCEIFVKSNDGYVIAQKVVSINVVNSMQTPINNKNVLCIGASATAGGQWVGELKRRLTENNGEGTPANPMGLGLNNITFVGRKIGTSKAVNLEATGGWRVQDYASAGRQAIRFYVSGVDTIAIGATYEVAGTTYMVQGVNITEGVGNIRCTLTSSYIAPPNSGILTKKTGSGDANVVYNSYESENYSPFWYNGDIDFYNYASLYCGGIIDVLIWHCGVNDLVGGDPAIIPNVIDSYKDLLNKYHTQFPNGKVILSSVPIGSVNGGFGANYGANKGLNYYTFAKIAQLYARALFELTQEDSFKNYVFYAPAMEQFDAENNYPVKETFVNNRSSMIEKIGTNAVHPIDAGSYQIADSMYRTMNVINL